jgi:hypothetical protein
MLKVPRNLRRLTIEIDGWLELDCPQRALERLQPLLDTPGARPVGLTFLVRANVSLVRPADALVALTELGQFEHDRNWFDLTEAWCRKRLDDLPGAIRCMERLIDRCQGSGIGHFNLACYLALAGDRARAIDEVSVACGIDERFRALAADDVDLASLRGEPEFERLLARRDP